MKNTKLFNYLFAGLFAVIAFALSASPAAAFTPKVDGVNLKLSLPQEIVVNKQFQVTAESTLRYKLDPRRLNNVSYTWVVDACGVKHTVVKNLSNDPVAYRHTINPVFKNGCKLNIQVAVLEYYRWKPSDAVYPGFIFSTIRKSGDINISGPAQVKVGTTGTYIATYKLTSNQKARWYQGKVCNITRIGSSTDPLTQNSFNFTWTPGSAMSCKVEASAVYTTHNSYGLVTDIEYATKSISVKSVK